LTLGSTYAFCQIPSEFLADSVDFRIESGSFDWFLVTEYETIKIDSSMTTSIDPSWIERIEVIKPKDETTENEKGQISITLKNEYEVQFLKKLNKKG